jgi:hypothetical protein
MRIVITLSAPALPPYKDTKKNPYKQAFFNLFYNVLIFNRLHMDKKKIYLAIRANVLTHNELCGFPLELPRPQPPYKGTKKN